MAAPEIHTPLFLGPELMDPRVCEMKGIISQVMSSGKTLKALALSTVSTMVILFWLL